LDTKWTKFKESTFTKTICIIIACLLLIGACSSGLKLVKYYNCYESDSSSTKFINSMPFRNMFINDVNDLVDAVTFNQRTAEIKSERERGAEECLKLYKEYEEKHNEFLENRKIQEQQEQQQYEDNEYTETTAVTEINEDYASSYFTDNIQVTIDNSVYSIDINIDCDSDYSDNDIKEKFYINFNISIEEASVTDEEFNKKGIKNLLYYAEATDGTVVSNVESKEMLTNNAENKTHLFFENGKTNDGADFYSNSGEIRPYRLGDYNANIYIIVNTEFTEDDYYRTAAKHTEAAAHINLTDCYMQLIICALLAFAFFIISICLAGHKNGKIQTAPIDKIPYDIHLLATSGLVTLGVMGFITYLNAYLSTYYSGYTDYMSDIPSFILNRPWYPLISYALVIITYLLTAEFFTSLARGIKAKTNIFKNTFIYKFLRFIVKTAVKILKGIKSIIKSIVYKPKHFSRKTIAIIVLYTLFNIIAMLFAWFLIFASNSGTVAFFGIIFALGVLALDGYIIYLVIKYLKALDNIITAVENGEPLAANNEKLPNSLEILAKSYDIANANLQSAIIKAVKDERTKAELITNVSHDLKTPLTSVINYIDLLQKCNIEDETAQEYMGVIAEKSNKLKRLIEDLIEASKISSGNVTINKTKLNLNELAAQAIVEETAEFEKRDLQLIFEEPASRHLAFADGTKIYRVFENLLSNAKKYSAPGSRVYARLYSGIDNEYFEIKNISKEPLNISAEELTERFVRGDKSRNEDGNGLGLSITTELCRLNNGVLEITIDGDLFKATVKIPKE